MKTLRQITTLILMALAITTIATKASAQRNDMSAMSGEVYFWFNVKVANTIDRETKIEGYSLRLISPTIYNGNLRKFQKALWEGTAHGTKIPVGPFTSNEEAKQAMLIYKGHKDATIGSNVEGSFSWFLVDVTILERSHSYQFERMAARVAFGSAKEFGDVLRESLSFKKLAIGPFYDDMQAEKSKSLYRIEE